MADELVRQRPRDAADGEGEDDVLDGRAVARFDDRADQLLHLERVEVAVDRASEDLVGVLLRVAGPAGRVDDRDVILLDDLAVREDERRLQPEVAAARVLGDPGLLARRLGRRRLGGHRRASLPRSSRPERPARSVVVRAGQEVAAAADQLALALVHRGAAVRAGQHQQAGVRVRGRGAPRRPAPRRRPGRSARPRDGTASAVTRRSYASCRASSATGSLPSSA